MGSEYTTVAVILYKSKKLANGEHPLMVRISKDRARKYISLGISCKSQDWDTKTNLPKKGHPQKDKIDSIISKAINMYKEKIIDFKHEGKDYTLDVLIGICFFPAKTMMY